jgi:hypothetical protein
VGMEIGLYELRERMIREARGNLPASGS